MVLEMEERPTKKEDGDGDLADLSPSNHVPRQARPTEGFINGKEAVSVNAASLPSHGTGVLLRLMSFHLKICIKDASSLS